MNFLWSTVCSILTDVNLSSFMYGAIQIHTDMIMIVVIVTYMCWYCSLLTS